MSVFWREDRCRPDPDARCAGSPALRAAGLPTSDLPEPLRQLLVLVALAGLAWSLRRV